MFELSNGVRLAVIAFPIGGVVAGRCPAPGPAGRFGPPSAAAVRAPRRGRVRNQFRPVSPCSAGLFVAGTRRGGRHRQNAQGLRVQRFGRTSIIDSIAALWSVGAWSGSWAPGRHALHVPLRLALHASAGCMSPPRPWPWVAMRMAVPTSPRGPRHHPGPRPSTREIPSCPGKAAALLALLPIGGGRPVRGARGRGLQLVRRPCRTCSPPCGPGGAGLREPRGSAVRGPGRRRDRLIDALSAGILVTRIRRRA
ncbi:hypothetical protein QJS66_12520 [Kocuria rhizophila]|nr:hypothetical protein QJS66_12520 [Kocuria rhizophila]